MAPRLIDISHIVEHGMVTYEGLPPPEISEFLTREESRSRYTPGTEFQIGRISLVANTGTYVDAPSHRFREGKDLSELPLTSVAHLPGMVVRVQEEQSIGREIFSGLETEGKAVLVHTGWDRHWRTDRYFRGHPFLTREAAEYLVAQRTRFVGIDSYNIDDTSDGSRPAHTALLAAGIPVCEHLCRLSEVPDSGFFLHAVPVRIKGLGSFPVRAYVVIP